MRGSREVHIHIRAQIEASLGGRTWTWLAMQSGIAQSTLAAQAARPKFSLDVLLAVADALEHELTFFLPDHDPRAVPDRPDRPTSPCRTANRDLPETG